MHLIIGMRLNVVRDEISDDDGMGLSRNLHIDAVMYDETN